MNILQVAAFAAPFEGNFIYSLEKLEFELRKKGHNVCYAFPYTAKEKEWCKKIEERAKVYYLPLEKARINIKTYILISKICKENNINIIHSHFELYDIPTKIMAHNGIKVFWHLHDAIDENKPKSREILDKIQYKYLSNDVFLVSVSDYYRKKLINRGMKEEKTITISNGINISKINKVDKSNNREIVFLTLGWDFDRKGVDIILNACKKLEEDNLKFKFILNGNKTTFQKLEKYFNGNIPKWIIFQEQVSDINKCYENADVYIQASRSETFSFAVCEAAYAGLPVIASDIAGHKWAKKLPTVEFFKSEDFISLYECMKDNILKYRDRDENLYITRKIIEEDFSVGRWVDDIVELYMK